MKLYGTGPCPLALVYGMGHVRLGNICLICRVINDHGPHFVCIIHPLLKLCFMNGSAGRVIGKTKIDQIRRFLRKLGRKIIFRGTGHIDHITPGLRVRIISSGPSRHHVGVHINRIHRVAHCNRIVRTENFLDIPGIALCPVGHKDFVCRNVASSCLVIVFRNGIP